MKLLRRTTFKMTRFVFQIRNNRAIVVGICYSKALYFVFAVLALWRGRDYCKAPVSTIVAAAVISGWFVAY